MEGDPGYTYEYNAPEPNVDSSWSMFRSYLVSPPKPVPVRTPDESGGFLSDVGAVISAPFKSLAGGISSGIDSIKGTVRNTFLYLVGGILLIGILGIVLLGAGTRFMGKIE